MDKLPEDLRLHCMRGLPPRDLTSLEATSTSLRDTSRSDVCWSAACLPYFQASPSALAPSAKQCYLTANGWADIASVQRTAISAEIQSTGIGGRTRKNNVLPQISAWDADDHRLLFATDPKVGRVLPSLTLQSFASGPGLEARRQTFECLLPANADPAFSRLSVEDIKLLPPAAAQPEHALLLCHNDAGTPPHVQALRSTAPLGTAGHSPQLVPLWTIAPPTGETMPHRLAWDNGGGGAIASDEPTASMDQIVAWGTKGVHLCDMRTGAVISTRSRLGHDPSADHVGLVDLCCLPHGGGGGPPHLLAMASQGGSYEAGMIALHDLRIGGPSTPPQMHLRTPHRLICRLRVGPDPHTLLTAHKICKDIELWDMRRPISGIVGGHFSTGILLPADSGRTFAHCAGNGPDFEYAHSTLVCLSRGSPGTTFGAKLQVFAERPRRIVNTSGAVLPEIVLDTFNRFGYAQSLRFGTKTLTILADRERFLRCEMPPVASRSGSSAAL